MDTRIDIQECIKFGWRTFKARPWFFIGAVALVSVISIILKIPESSLPDDQKLSFLAFAYGLLSMAVSILVDFAFKSLALTAHDNVGSARLASLWRGDRVLPFIGASILVGIIVIVGLILLVIPGVIAAVALVFATFLVLDKNMSPIEALKESMRITKGRRLSIAGLLIVLGLLNILGFLLLAVGLLVTVPVSLIALVHAYRTLSAPVATPAAVVADSVPAI
jgi:uncharacterized membrane protein